MEKNNEVKELLISFFKKTLSNITNISHIENNDMGNVKLTMNPPEERVHINYISDEVKQPMIYYRSLSSSLTQKEFKFLKGLTNQKRNEIEHRMKTDDIRKLKEIIKDDTETI